MNRQDSILLQGVKQHTQLKQIMNTGSTGATSRYFKGKRQSHDVNITAQLTADGGSGDNYKGFRSRASVKPISHMTMEERHAVRRYRSKKRSTKESHSISYTHQAQSTTAAQTTEANELSMSFGRKHYAEINELTAVRVKRKGAPSIAVSEAT